VSILQGDIFLLLFLSVAQSTYGASFKYIVVMAKKKKENISIWVTNKKNYPSNRSRLLYTCTPQNSREEKV
jgi:hypothetical protein